MVKVLVAESSEFLNRFCRLGSIVFFGLMVLLVMFQVVARYIFAVVPNWTAEAARYCMVWGGLLGATVAFKTDRDPKVTKPPTSGPRTWVKAAALLRGLSVLIFMGPVLYHSYRFLLRQSDRTAEALGISLAWVTASVPFSILVIFLHLGSRLLKDGKDR